MKTPRILFISPRQCWPHLSGAKLREYYFLRALGRDAKITYVHFIDNDDHPRVKENLPFCEQVISIPRPSTFTVSNLTRGAIGRWPVSVLNYTSPKMAAAIEGLSGPYDLVHMDSIHMTRYTEVAARMPNVAKRVVYSWHNIESELVARHGEGAGSPMRRWYADMTARKLEAVEREVLETAFGHIVCSDREREHLQRMAPRARIAAVENGVDTAYFEGAADRNSPRRRILYVGKMNYPPNFTAATNFVRRIWPEIMKQMPGTTLTIAGSDPVESVRALDKVAGVTVTGTVPDLRPYYRDALASVVPLLAGGGTRLKILEAMAAGVPVISTAVGAEGLAVERERDILIADVDKPEEWIAHLKRLAEAPGESAKIVARGLDLVKTRYDWEIVSDTLRKTYEEWLGSPA